MKSIEKYQKKGLLIFNGNLSFTNTINCSLMGSTFMVSGTLQASTLPCVWMKDVELHIINHWHCMIWSITFRAINVLLICVSMDVLFSVYSTQHEILLWCKTTSIKVTKLCLSIVQTPNMLPLTLNSSWKWIGKSSLMGSQFRYQM